MGLIKSIIGTKTISMLGLLNAQLETKMQIHKNPQEVGHFQSCMIKGRIKVDDKPMFIQYGQTQLISKNSLYLVLNLLQIHASDAFTEYGDPEVWATVNWGGQVLKSKKIKRSQLNETFYFQLSISEKRLKKASKFERVTLIMDELREKPEIEVNVWLDPKTSVYEHLGCAAFQISEIANGSQIQKQFTDYKSRQVVTFDTVVFAAEKRKLQSKLKDY